MDTTDEKHREAIAFKDKGNELVKEKKLEEAKEAYSAAIDLVPTNELFWSNRSMVYFQLKDGLNALADAEQCITINPNWGRGYSRKVNALQLLGRHEEIIETCRKGLAVEQSEALVKNLTIACLELLEGKFWGTTSAAQGAYDQELEFCKDKSTLKVRFFGQEIVCTYRIDPTKSPMTMMIEMPQQPPILHIFQFTAQGIDLCSPGMTGAAPTAFEGDGLIQLTRGAQPEEPEDLSLQALSPQARLAQYVEEAIEIVPSRIEDNQADAFFKIIQFQKHFYKLRTRFGQETADAITHLLQGEGADIPQELRQRIHVLRDKMREARLFEPGPEEEEEFQEAPTRHTNGNTDTAGVSSSSPPSSSSSSSTKETKEQPVNPTVVAPRSGPTLPLKICAAFIVTGAVAAAIWHFFYKKDSNNNNTTNNGNK